MTVVVLFLCVLVSVAAFGLEHKTGVLWEPYLEWKLEYSDQKLNEYDIHATAVFKHGDGQILRSPIFFSGEGDIWKFRFTGIRLGKWEITTEGPGSLGNQTGKVIVEPNPNKNAHGFVKAFGQKWGWSGTREAFVPQLAMGKPPSAFWKEGKVDTAAIDAYVHEFITGHGFTGFHLEGRAYWFGIDQTLTMTKDRKPLPEEKHGFDLRTFSVFEEIIQRTYKAGGMCHIWLWGSDNSGSSKSGPWGIGGHSGPTAKRLMRYIAARLGPLPGWSMGYGFDLDRWVHDPDGRWVKNPDVLPEWHRDFTEALGGWPHILGARAHTCEFKEYPKHDHPPKTIFWSGDYAGYVNFRPAYGLYVETIDQVPGQPAFQEDRYRIRESKRFAPKDYLDPNMMVRGLWHSTMAGGVANIWGNLSEKGNEGGSIPFDKGSINGAPVRIKTQIKTYSKFFFEKKRFRTDLIRDNSLTEFQDVYRLDPNPSDGNYNLCVCLRSEGPRRLKHFIFFRENCSEIPMDLSHMNGRQPAVAVDTRKLYHEIKLERLDPKHQVWSAPYKSDWAIAVGVFE